MTIRCILCLVSGGLLAGMLLSMMASTSNADEPANKPDEKSDRAKKILEALDEPGTNPNADPKVDPKVKPGPMPKGPKRGKNQPMAPVQPMELTPAQRVQQMLAAADADGSGTLSRQEVGALIDSLGPAGQQIGPKMADLFRRLDRNRDNQLTPQEAAGGMQDIATLFTGEKVGNRGPAGNPADAALGAVVQQIVGKLDRNKDGKISEQEAGNDKEVAARFAMADANQDKELSPEEIMAFLQKALPMLKADNK